MILIADSGSTKTSWYFYKNSGQSEIITTGGLNPFFRTTRDIAEELQKYLIPVTGTSIDAIYFYGAGIINPEKGMVVKQALRKFYKSADIETESDLLASARATLQTETGIACILGTGMNSCFYDGRQVAEHIPPLGFILGDEGSGACIGSRLVADYLKGIMPAKLAAKFNEDYKPDYAGFLESVYKKDKPNKFLAGFVPFVSRNIDNEYCSHLVEKSFNEFIDRNIKLYSNYKNQKISFVGSVAFHFQEQLKKVLTENNLITGDILKEPLGGLARFHLNK